MDGYDEDGGQRPARTSDAPQGHRDGFAAFLGIYDDIDVLPAAINHLREIGVRMIAVFDFGSTDGSLDYVADTEADGDVWLFHANSVATRGLWRPAQAKLARALDVDWVLFLDADEFWLPVSGSLVDSGDARTHDVLTVMRFNVVCGPDGPMMPERISHDSYDDILVHAQPIPDFFHYMENHPDASWMEGQLEPKVMARPDAIQMLHRGAHDIDLTQEQAWRRAIATDILIAHAPFRSYEQFERKAQNVALAVQRAPHMFTGSQGWQWVRWARMHAEGTVRKEWERQAISPRRLGTLRTSGRIRSVAEILRQPIPNYATERSYEAAARSSQPWVMAAGLACKRQVVAARSDAEVAAGGQYPTVRVPPGHVVKLYGPWKEGHSALVAEEAALRVVARDAQLPVPRLIARGRLDDDWEYLIMTLVPGQPLGGAGRSLPADERRRLASWLGDFVRRLHAIPFEPTEAERAVTWFRDEIRRRHARLAGILADGRVLPPRLVARVREWMPSLEELEVASFSPVILHADLHAGHVFGHHAPAWFGPTGVIDFNRARFGHPLYELGPIWRFIASGDPAFMQTFLSAAELPGRERPDFPRLALAWCLLHEGVGQRPVALPSIRSIGDLDELAHRSFAA